MSRIRASVTLLAILGLCAWSLNAQDRILRDAAAAAAGGTGGVAAGQQVGKGIAGIFGKVSAASTKAASVEGAGKTPVVAEEDAGVQVEPVVPPDGVTIPPQATKPRPATQPKPAQHAAAPRTTPRPASVIPPAIPDPILSRPPAPAITKDDLAGVDPGLKRAELVTKLGRPAARVIIPEDGQLREIYLFSGSRAHLGTVELVDGAVSAIKVSRF